MLQQNGLYHICSNSIYCILYYSIIFSLIYLYYGNTIEYIHVFISTYGVSQYIISCHIVSYHNMPSTQINILYFDVCHKVIYQMCKITFMSIGCICECDTAQTVVHLCASPCSLCLMSCVHVTRVASFCILTCNTSSVTRDANEFQVGLPSLDVNIG